MIQPPASHHIAGAYAEDRAGEAFETLNPATGEPVARLHAATPAVVERAVAAASEGFARWRAWSPVARGRVLRRAAEIIRLPQPRTVRAGDARHGQAPVRDAGGRLALRRLTP
jgi:acyl-CoA reductase-like NAD-dependent aldehyde dehydrogenase